MTGDNLVNGVSVMCYEKPGVLGFLSTHLTQHEIRACVEASRRKSDWSKVQRMVAQCQPVWISLADQYNPK